MFRFNVYVDYTLPQWTWRLQMIVWEIKQHCYWDYWRCLHQHPLITTTKEEGDTPC